MKRIVFVLAALALGTGCSGGGGGSHAECSDAEPCSAGNYCAHTPDGNVCWPDTTAPVVANVRIVCSTSSQNAAGKCLRNGVVHVSATVTEEHGVQSVTATLNGDAAHPITLTESGGEYAADASLEDLPFPYFEKEVTASVTATDAANNPASADSSVPVTVTRSKWERSLNATALSTPALASAGVGEPTIVVAGSVGGQGQLLFLRLNGDDARAPASVGSGAISGPPAIGADAIWVVGEDSNQYGNLYAFTLHGEANTLPANCKTPQALVGPPAVTGRSAIVASSGDRIFAATSAPSCNAAVLSSGATSSTVLSGSGKAYVVTGGVLRKYNLPPDAAPDQEWTGVSPAPAVGAVAVPLALGADDAVWSVSGVLELFRTTPTATATRVATLEGASAGPVLLADGTVITCSLNGVLQATLLSGSVAWAKSAALSGVPVAPLVLKSTAEQLLVPSTTGYLHLVDAPTGQVVWQTRLSSTNKALQPANIWTEPGAKTSTAYISGADGKLYAVIVDGALDTSAPWPKAYHDPQNTSNAGTAP